MRNFEEEIEKIMTEYDQNRMTARIRRDERVKKINAEHPKLSEIERKISMAGAENIGKILQNPEKSDEYNSEFEKTLKKLNEEKAEYLKENNIPSDYDEVKYTCEMCLDTGYIDTKKCPCFVNKLMKLHYRMSNMENMLHDFSEFSFDYYSDEKAGSMDITEKENMREIYDTAVRFCSGEDEKNLLFYGGCGVGKTFLSSCMAKKMMDSGKTVLYVSAAGLFSEYEDYKFGRRTDFEQTLEMLETVDLLILDDLGVETKSPVSVQFFFDIVVRRINSGKKIVISTNLTLKGITERYSERAESRIFEKFRVLHFIAKDIRLEKLRQE